MAVMTSSAIDKLHFDIKAAAPLSPGAMALDSEANGVHDISFDERSQLAPEDTAPESLPQPTVNGNHIQPDSEMDAPGDMDSVPVPHFPQDAQTDANSLFGGSDIGATSVTNAIEAPTSDIREEPAPEPTTQPAAPSPQRVPETQLSGAQEEVEHATAPDPMDVSQDDHDEPSRDPDSNAQSLDTAPTKPMTELTLQTQQSPLTSSNPALEHSTSNVDQEMEDTPASGKVRSREEFEDEEAPEAKRAKTEGEEGSGSVEFKVPEVPVHSEQTNGNAGTQVKDASQTPTSSTADQLQSAADAQDWPTTPMTQAQNKFLLERTRNTKKIKGAIAFKEPVNPELLGIPTYRTIVTNPMDLSTMESKLKEGKYPYVRDFMADLDLVVNNSILFNGKDHPVTLAGQNMRAYFLKGIGKMPKGEEPVKPAKVKKTAVATSTKTKREPRVTTTTAKSPTVPTPTAASPQAAWPLGADGVPLIRRDSSSINDRPKREIHRPPPKDLPYNNAKPRKKKYQQELRFCESVLSEIVKPKYAKFAYPFLVPVDPVALNIPSYLKIIKKPMDFGTIEKNLKAGQYQTAKDFYNDAQLVFQNCYKFNPETDEVHKMGKQLNQLFDELWKEKSEWLAQHAPASDPQSPGSAYSDEEEEEDEEELDPAQAQIIAIQKQIQQLNETAQSLLQQQKSKRSSPNVPSRKKTNKASSKKKNSLAVPPPPKTSTRSKPRTKAPAPLSFAQKQEISEGISTLGDAEMRRAVQIIRNGCPHLANVNDDEMEIDMDEISDDTLRELFKFIKQVRGPKQATVDDDFEPPRPAQKAVANKPKKNKPMGKKEQEENIKRIQDQLRRFEGSASGSSQSPPANQDDSSDDESSGSESEEE